MYEPAMTKAFLHGRTEAIRSIQPQSVEFTKVVKAIDRLDGHILITTVIFLDLLL